ncbi:MAG TPA: CYTH domain-containing protein [candidate division Zixibacteria bacterium]|nr:CYTH domain-containing protein [candidate division Zixibacteria bacterium]
MPVGLELELKLQADGAEPLRALAGAERLGPATLDPPGAVDEVDRYLDDASGSLARARWACRLRVRDGRTLVSLKGPAQQRPGDAAHRRPELEGPATSDSDPSAWPPSEARQLLLRMVAPGSLRERVRLEQRRVERVARLDGRRIGMLSLDTVEVVHGDHRLGTLHIVELELDPGQPQAVVDTLAAALRSRPGLRPDPLSKLEHALGMLRPDAAATPPAGGGG